MIGAARDRLALDDESLNAILAPVRAEFGEISGLFDLAPASGTAVLDLFQQTLAVRDEAGVC